MENTKNIVMKYYCPIQINFKGYDSYGAYDDDEYGKLDPRSAVYYADEIRKAVTAYDDGNLAEYFDENASAAAKLISAYWDVEVVDGVLYGCIEATLKEPFTNEEEVAFKDYIEGQNSDGFGEGFEQQEIKVDDGWINVNYWQRGDKYFVYNEREFLRHIGKKQPYNFAHKDTEKCRNAWWHRDTSDRVTIAFLEFENIDINVGIENSKKGDREVCIFVCRPCSNGSVNEDYLKVDGQTILSEMTSWQQVEDFLYDALISYCDDRRVEATPAVFDGDESLSSSKMPLVCMKTDFRILKRHYGPSGPIYLSLRKEDLSEFSPGSFTFTVNSKNVPFDFDARSCSEELGIFRYETGRGLLLDDFTVSSDFDKALAAEGLSREDLTAEFLASVSKIQEFLLEFQDKKTPVTDGGWYGSNLEGEPQFKVEFLQISFADKETGKEYFVRDDVLEAFNRGK